MREAKLPNSSKHFSNRRLTNWLIFMFLGMAAAFLLKEALDPVTTFYDVDFPAGEVSFVDTIVSYEPIVYLNEDKLPNVREPFNNPVSALGAPNSTSKKHPLSSLSERHDVSLGMGGRIVLRFTNNALTGSGDDAPDLWIFEAGEKTESVFVEISKDGKSWKSVGHTDNKHNGIDIDAFGLGPEDYFAYVRLTDDIEEGENNGVWYEGEWVGWGGADIDAVGAISSVSLISSVSHSASFVVASPFLLVSAILVAGIAIGYLINTLLATKKSSQNDY
jgi:hypothetical protein